MSKQKKRSKGPLLFILLVLLVALLLGGMKLGFIPGGQALGLAPETEQSNTPVQTPTEAGSNQYTIRVEDTEITLDGEMISLAELQERIKGFNQEDQITLVDAQAIKATYESIVTSLEESGLDYTSAQE